MSQPAASSNAASSVNSCSYVQIPAYVPNCAPTCATQEQKDKDIKSSGAGIGVLAFSVIVLTLVLLHEGWNFLGNKNGQNTNKVASQSKPTGVPGMPGAVAPAAPGVSSGGFIASITTKIKGSLENVGLGLIVAIMLSGVILTFNATIMNPLVQIAIPNLVDLKKGFALDGDGAIYIYPGQFFISLLSFILSIIVLSVFVFILDFIYQGANNLYKKFTKSPTGINPIIALITVILVLLIGVLSWSSWNFENVIQPMQTCSVSGKTPQNNLVGRQMSLKQQQDLVANTINKQNSTLPPNILTGL